MSKANVDVGNSVCVYFIADSDSTSLFIATEVVFDTVFTKQKSFIPCLFFFTYTSLSTETKLNMFQVCLKLHVNQFLETFLFTYRMCFLRDINLLEKLFVECLLCLSTFAQCKC